MTDLLDSGTLPCPRCGTPHPAGAAECTHCGVIFAKLAGAGLITHPAPPAAATGHTMPAAAAPMALPASRPPAAAPADPPRRSPGLVTWLVLAVAILALVVAWQHRAARVAAADLAPARPDLPRTHRSRSGATPALFAAEAFPGATVVRTPYVWYEGAAGYQSAVDEARDDNHPMTVYFRTDWCPACKQFDQELLSSEEVQDFLRHVVKVRINPESGKEEGSLGAHYSVDSFPSLFLHKPGQSTYVRIDDSVDNGRYLASPAQFVGILRAALK